MKRLHVIRTEHHDGIADARDRINEAFLAKDRETISHAEIKALATDLAREIQAVLPHAQDEGECFAILLKFLQADSLMRFAGARGMQIVNRRSSLGISVLRWIDEGGKERTIDEDELEAFLYPIREAVIRELSAAGISRDNLQVFIKSLTSDRRIWMLHDSRILKYLSDPRFSESEIQKECRLQALARLFELPERSPYISYHILGFEDSLEYAQGIQIQKQLQFRTLEDVLCAKYGPRSGRIPLSRQLGYVCDTAKGALFLIKNGLRLTDLNPCNVYIDQEHDRGKLFDYDGLSIAGHLVTYLARMDYFPSERISRVSVPAPVTEAEMVYEIGTMLDEVLENEYGPLSDNSVFHLAEQMTEENPSRRPLMSEVVTQLQSMIE